MGPPAKRIFDVLRPGSTAGFEDVEYTLNRRDERSLQVSLLDPHPNAAGHRLHAEALLHGLATLPARC